MIKMTKAIVVAAPQEKIFDVLNDIANIPEIWRNLSNIHNLKDLPNGGHSFEFDYTMAGITIHGTSTDLVYDRPNRTVTRTTGGIISTLSWTLTPHANGVNVVFTADYEAPIPVVGKLAETIIAKVNETDMVYVLNYLKLKFK